LPDLRRAAHSPESGQRRAGREGLASLYAVLGLYERAVELDRRRLRTDPGAITAGRRLVWSLLRLGRSEESLEAARQLEQMTLPEDGLSRLLIDTARELPELSEPEARERLARIPVLTRPQALWLGAGFQPPQARRR
jgi:hypothetical protein